MKLSQIIFVVSFGVVLVSSMPTQEEGKRLIKTSEEKPGEWMTQEEIANLIRTKKTFIDITDSKYPAARPGSVKSTAVPTALRYKETVEKVKARLNPDRVKAFVETFSNYHNRYYASATGRQSQLWLLEQVRAAAGARASVREVDHGYLQRSIVARLEGVSPTLKNEVVIFGAHLDSVNKFGASLSAPGADDNGSGSSVVLETLTTIVEENLRFNRTIEFHWYAAEEIGLRGSQAIAEEYRDANVNVAAMLNMDVVGYFNGTKNVGVFTDNTESPELVQFLRVIAGTGGYLGSEWGWQNRTCGYGCSDHASWTRNEFPAVMASELLPHPDMHTTDDSITNAGYSYEQIHEFVKVALGFTIEIAEPALA